MTPHKLIASCLFLLITVTACANGATTTPHPTSTATSIPSPTSIPITPTVLATPTGISLNATTTAAVSSIDITQPSSGWSANAQTQFKDVLTNPNTATDQEKAAYDAAVIADMQTLSNTEGKTGYDLLDAFIAFTQKNNIHEVSAFPFSLQQQIITDINNVIAHGYAPANADPFNGKFKYGYAWRNDHDANPPTQGSIRNEMFINSINFFGQSIERSSSTNLDTPLYTPEGDLVLRFNLPGVDPDTSQGGLLQMFDQNGETRYAVIIINYRQTQTTTNDSWISYPAAGGQDVGEYCDAGANVKATTLAPWVGAPPVTRAILDSDMAKANGRLHIGVNVALPNVGNKGVLVIYRDGALMVSWISIFDPSMP